VLFFFWSLVVVDLLPAASAATLMTAAHRWSRSPRAFHAWARALGILGAQLILVAVLIALLLIAVLCFQTPTISATLARFR
jgi:hypothetical protein